jgi:zinc D-Ala-D-Ala carboxypeptidase
MGKEMTTYLTPHFTLEEMTYSETAARKGINNVPPSGSKEYIGIVRTCETMEKVRTLLHDKPILVSSGYRCPAVNSAIGGSSTSAHMSGLAVDFHCPEFGTPKAICKHLEHHMKSLEIDQLIHEYDTWVHLGLTNGTPRHMAMTIDNKGTRNGF